jgi:hypothetical protein
VQRTGSFAAAFLVAGVIAVLGAASWAFLLGPLEEMQWDGG